jgi:hypothetical protein
MLELKIAVFEHVMELGTSCELITQYIGNDGSSSPAT